MPLFMHGSGEHSLMSTLQLSPAQPEPAMHAQAYWDTASALSVLESEQTAPWRHGLTAHSSVSTEQLSPSHPGAQMHKKSPINTVASVLDSAQVKPVAFVQAASPLIDWYDAAHSSMSSAQLWPS